MSGDCGLILLVTDSEMPWMYGSGFPGGGRCAPHLVGNCDKAFRWTIPAALKHFLEEGFSAVLRGYCSGYVNGKHPKISLRMPAYTII